MRGRALDRRLGLEAKREAVALRVRPRTGGGVLFHERIVGNREVLLDVHVLEVAHVGEPGDVEVAAHDQGYRQGCTPR